MSIRLSFRTWNEKRTYRFIMNRIWLKGFWTPFIKIKLRLPQATYNEIK